MPEVQNIHGYNISHRGNVANGLRYIENNWDSEIVKTMFREARENKVKGHNFEINSYGYTLFYDGDHKYFLKAR